MRKLAYVLTALALASAIMGAIVVVTIHGSRPQQVSSRCADLIAKAVTSPFAVVHGSGDCFVYEGKPISDGAWVGFSRYPPVFDQITKSCGYRVSDHTFTYVISNSVAGVRGLLTIPVDAQGRATDATKEVTQASGSTQPVSCPRGG